MILRLNISTSDELEEAGDIGRCELIRGKLHMMTPAGGEHGDITIKLTVRLANHVDENQLGIVLAAETGFVISRDPDTVRAPDIAFISTKRLEITRTKKFISGAPDLAVEVLSPSDRAGESLNKVHDWLSSGCLAVWVVDPNTRTLTVYEDTEQARIYSADDELTGDPVVPGFSVRIGDIFPSV